MNFVRKIYSRNALSVLDFGAESVVALVVEKKADGYQVLGAAESRAAGVDATGIRSLSDATEAVVTALRGAERSSGIKTRSLYYNFDDAGMVGTHVRASLALPGEGEIRPQTVQQTRQVAERLTGDFYKSVVYAREIGFLIDDRDPVVNPVGVFGRKLEVVMQFLLARAEVFDLWKQLMRRAGVSKSVPVASILSTAYGILPNTDRQRKRLILDLGKDFLNLFVFENNGIRDSRLVAAEDADWRKAVITEAVALGERNPGLSQVLVTGDQAGDEKIIEGLKNSFQAPVFQSSPLGVPKLQEPRFASLAGLIQVAEEFEKKKPLLERQKGVFSGVKEKAASFVNEYF